MMRSFPASRDALLIALAVFAVLPRSLPAQEQGGQKQNAAPAQSSRAAIRQYRVAVEFQNRGVYDLAADEWAAFLKDFPNDPLASKAQHYLGVCKLQLKQYGDAIAAFTTVIEKYPKHDQLDVTYLNLGLSHYFLGQGGQAEAYDQAVKMFRKVTEDYPESAQRPRALFNLAEALYAQGKKQEAADVYQQLIAKDPKSELRADAVYALGVTQEELQQPAAAGATYDLFLKEFSDHPLRAEVIMRRGETLFATGKFADAEKWFASAAASKGFALADHATIRQAASLYEQKKYPEAAALYASLPTTFPESNYRGAAAVAAGNCYYLAGNLPDAERWLRQSLEAGGATAPEAAHWLARVLIRQKQPAKAIEVVERVLPQAAESPFAVNLLMDQADAAFEIADRRNEAVKLYAALAEEHPQHALAPHALYMAGFAALSAGDAASSLTYAQSFLKSYPEDALLPDVKHVAAESALLLGKYPEAEQFYGDLVAKHSSHPDLEQWKVRTALVLFLQKKYDQVVAALSTQLQDLKSPPAQAEANYLVGSSQYELQQYEAAHKSLSASLAADSKWRQADETLLALAATYRQLNKLPEAAATVRKIIAEFPTSKLLDRAHYRLGEYLYAAGDYQSAEAEYRTVIEKWPSSLLTPHAIYGLGWARLGRQDFSAAAEAFTALIEKHADHALIPRAHYARSMARQQLKDYSAAMEDAQVFLKSNPSGAEKSDALYIQGLSAAGLQQFDAAVQTFRAILSDDPQYASADKVLYELGWALKSQKKEAEAAEAFAKLAADHAGSALAAESLYHVGEFAYTEKDYAGAARAYFNSMNKAIEAGGTELGEKAAHKLGWSYYQQALADSGAKQEELWNKAQKQFEFQLSKFPQGTLAGDAQFMAAEILFKQNKHEAALAAYQKSMSQSPSNPDFRVLALLHAGQSAAQLKKWDDSLKLLEQGAKDFPQSPYLPELLFERGWAKQNQNKLDEAFKLYEQVADQADREVGARARFMMGEILFLKKDYKEAIRNYFKVAYGYGYPNSPEPIQKWQANSAYEAAVCFEALKLPEQAKKSYREVIDKYPQSDKVPQAKTRLEALGG